MKIKIRKSAFQAILHIIVLIMFLAVFASRFYNNGGRDYETESALMLKSTDSEIINGVFIRDENFSDFDIEEYWEKEVIRDKELHQHEINRIKAEKGKSGSLYQNGYFIGKPRSIREVEAVLNIRLIKKSPYKYTCRDYEYILDEVS